MRIPALKVISLGEISAWGKQFLAMLQQGDVVQVQHEPNVLKFINSLAPIPEPLVLFIENYPQSRAAITSLRQSSRKFYLVWFGRSFSREDYAFAIEQRIYCVFENLKATDKQIDLWIQRLLQNHEATSQVDRLIRSMKSILIQSEADELLKPLVTELRTAMGKLERASLQNEFKATHEPALQGQSTNLPFHRSQEVSDAITTMHDLERTGTLWVRGALPGEEGRLEFLQGRLVSAKAGEARGLKAIFRIFLWDGPRFLFTRREPTESTVDENFNFSLKYICDEGNGFRQRYEMIRRELPPYELNLALDPAALHAGTQLPPVDFSTLASVVEFGTVREILDYNPLADVEIYEALIRLKREHIIRLAA